MVKNHRLLYWGSKSSLESRNTSSWKCKSCASGNCHCHIGTLHSQDFLNEIVPFKLLTLVLPYITNGNWTSKHGAFPLTENKEEYVFSYGLPNNLSFTIKSPMLSITGPIPVSKYFKVRRKYSSRPWNLAALYGNQRRGWLRETHLISENVVGDEVFWKRSVLFPAADNWSKWISQEITSPDRCRWVFLNHQGTEMKKLLPQPEDKNWDIPLLTAILHNWDL